MENKIITYKNLEQYTTGMFKKIDDNDALVLENANSYTDEAVAKKSQVQFHIWEEND